ncbi:IS3 family insertion sequence transposase protein (plasmid) [Rhizobium etli]|uniref:IS3 family insertion sequence transposase protein n=1 Tax=Rhizobium etli TaxID=29449 RepID=A0AAN1BMH0_RHIET|nr:IS3 family insertion sequence transposase protein [Rhizobium etli]ARQ13201.1 IS3 family insertion sequence transposase protein [Rhizobium etli]
MRPARKRKLVDTVKADWKVSIRRACSVLKIDRSLYVYKSRRGEQAELKLKIKDICQTRVRYGYQRGTCCSSVMDGRLTRSESIAFPKRWTCSSATRFPSDGSKRSCGPTARNRPIPIMSGPWTLSTDQLATGRKIRVLTAVDTFSRFSPAVDARFCYRGEDVVQTLERVCRQIAYPAAIRVDNGSEFISRDLDLWAYHKGVLLHFSRPGKPTDNSYIESYGKFRAECLNAHWFMSLDDARAKMEDWRREYNPVS